MDLEPLVTHLEPQFGNIYDYRSWTVELKAAVRHYLIEIAPEELYERFLGHIGHHQVPSGSRVEQTDFILDHYRPWGVGAGLRCAAVAITSTLDELIDQLERASPVGNWGGAALWLTRHATDVQIIRMAQDSGHPELLEIKKGAGLRNPDAYDLVAVVPLPQLRALWDHVKFDKFQFEKVAYRSPTGSRKRQTAKSTRDSGLQAAASQVRRWARAHGHPVRDRGRIPGSVMQAFEAAHSSLTYK